MQGYIMAADGVNAKSETVNIRNTKLLYTGMNFVCGSIYLKVRVHLI